jgi:hypothetical protein
MLISRSDAFLIDALVFPGNSGGPVVLRPEIVSINGTPPQNRSYLIGMVVSYQPYIDVAVSQTDPTGKNNLRGKFRSRKRFAD